MVRLHVKCGDESQFLFETTVNVKCDELIEEIATIYNARLKIERICSQMEEMAKYGTMLPPDMLGLTKEQIEELNRVDKYGESCIPTGGYKMNPDPIGRRNGKQPSSKKIQEMLSNTITQVKNNISAKMTLEENICLAKKDVEEEMNSLKGAVTIVYPMNLPPHDPIRLEFENKEDLSGTQDALRVIPCSEAELWFVGKQIQRGEYQLKDFIGSNEKTKVIVKLQKRGGGVPGREPSLSSAEQRALMEFAFKKQQEAKNLAEAEDDDDDYLNSAWADSSALKKNFHGLGNLSWRPK